MSVQIGTVQTFKDVKADKEQAIKILEEAGEVVDAFKAYREAALTDWTEPDNVNEYRMACDHLIDECADVLQATCNLLSALNVVDITKWIERCKAKNERRGREYERDLEPSARVTEVGKSSAISRQADVDSREQLEADVQKWCGKYAYQADMVWAWLNRQAAITRAELVDCANCPITERNAKVIAELREQLDETKHAIAKAGGTWTEREDGSVAVVFAPDVGKLRADLEAAHAKNRALKAHIGKMQDGRHGWHVKAKELQEQVDSLTAERDELKVKLEKEEQLNSDGWTQAFENANVADENARRHNALLDKYKQLEAERDYWRDKCGKMLDVAHEIARLGDVE